MIRKTEKLDLLCDKYYLIPSLALANINNEITFMLWYDQFKEYPNIVNVEIKKLEEFTVSINHPFEFLKLKKEVISEIEDNLFEASNEYELKKYFTYVKNKTENIFAIASNRVNLLNRVDFTELEDLDHLNVNEIAFRYLFYLSMANIKECFKRFLDVQQFIQQQEQLYLNSYEFDEPLQPIKIEKISDSLSHKILLLHELGIIEYLQKEYLHPQQTLRNGTALANLISNIIGEPKKSETIRKHISGIHSKGKDNIVTNPGIKEVKRFLAQFHIPLKRLKDKD